MDRNWKCSYHALDNLSMRFGISDPDSIQTFVSAVFGTSGEDWQPFAVNPDNNGRPVEGRLVTLEIFGAKQDIVAVVGKGKFDDPIIVTVFSPTVIPDEDIGMTPKELEAQNRGLSQENEALKLKLQQLAAPSQIPVKLQELQDEIADLKKTLESSRLQAHNYLDEIEAKDRVITAIKADWQEALVYRDALRALKAVWEKL